MSGECNERKKAAQINDTALLYKRMRGLLIYSSEPRHIFKSEWPWNTCKDY